MKEESLKRKEKEACEGDGKKETETEGLEEGRDGGKEILSGGTMTYKEERGGRGQE